MLYLSGYFYNCIQDENGNKAVNEYVREYKIGSGSYGKVVSIVFSILSLKENSFPDPLSMNALQALYRSSVDGKHYAIKVRYFFQFGKTYYFMVGNMAITGL
jgi:hypothetical protein